MSKAPSIPKPAALAAPTTASKLVGLPATSPGVIGEAFEEDFTDVKDGYPMAEEGMHHAKVIDFEKAESRGGNPQYVWQLRITAGASKDIEIRFWTSLLPQARWKAAEALAAVGIQAAGSVARFTKGEVVGQACIVEVIHDTYDGRVNHKVARLHPPNAETTRLAKGDNTPF